jgi:hypothetical protein
MVLTIVATVGAVLTLIPWPGADYPNVLGYRSLCPFAPAATLYCLLIAGVSCFFRASLVKDQEGSARQRLRRHRIHLVPLVLVAALAVAATLWHAEVKSRYPDGSGGATPAGSLNVEDRAQADASKVDDKAESVRVPMA